MASNDFGIQKDSYRRTYIGKKLTELLIRKTVGKKERGERFVENDILREIRHENRRTHATQGDNAKLLTKKIITLEKNGTLSRQEAAKAKRQITSLVTGRAGSNALGLLHKVKQPEPPAASKTEPQRQAPPRVRPPRPITLKPGVVSSIRQLQEQRKLATAKEDAATSRQYSRPSLADTPLPPRGRSATPADAQPSMSARPIATDLSHSTAEDDQIARTLSQAPDSPQTSIPPAETDAAHRSTPAPAGPVQSITPAAPSPASTASDTSVADIDIG